MSTAGATESQLAERLKPGSRFGIWSTWARLARRKPLGTLGAVFLLVFVFLALAAPLVAPYDPYQVSRTDRLQGPSIRHFFGADQSGRDLLSRIIYGAQISMGIGIGASAISTILSASIGTFSAFRGGRVDLVLQRIVDAVQALPTLVMLLAASFVVGRGALTLMLLIGVLFGIRSSRVVRGAALSVIQNEYVTAARAIGASDWRILGVYILPNVFAPIMVLTTVQLGAVILNEASLSFLNLGVPPPSISWGQMLALTSLPYMIQAPWIALAPGMALTAVVFGVNMFGDALRDLVDPRLRRGGQA